MVTKSEILDVLHYDFLSDKDPMNTTDGSRYVMTYQYSGTIQPADLPVGNTFTGWSGFDSAEKVAFEAVLAHIETFLNIDFVEVTGQADPDINVGKIDLPGTTIGLGGPGISYSGTKVLSWDGFVVYDNTLDLSLEAQQTLLLHEMGHALGLDHPFGGVNALPASEDSHKYSVMTYNNNPDNDIRSDAMMLYDVYALQAIWGSAAYNETDSIYTGSRTDTVDTVWDTGGKDLFNAKSIKSDVVLDLREGAFSTFGSYPDVVIAYGTQIENATGGSGSDTITGNDLRNVLKGGGGNDVISGGGENDRIKGGGGKDTLSGDAGQDRLLGQNRDDNIRGGADNDVLKGGRGNDTLDGEAGNDKLFGNGGADTFLFSIGGDQDIIRDFADNVDTIKITGLGTKTEIMSNASQVGTKVVFDFGDGDTLTVLNSTISQITDDILV